MNIFALWFLLFYLWHIFGITIGYHRLLSHRAFKCAKPLEYFFVAGAYLAFESSPITWVVVHRSHHSQADLHCDPHSPKSGLFHSYIGWMLNFRYSEAVNPARFAPDLLKDPVYRFLEQDEHLVRAYLLCALVSLAFRIVLLLTCGPSIAIASILAAILAQQLPLILNVVCHLPSMGYRNFCTADSSTNVWWLAMLTMGEGWHNNHHASPSSPRFSARASEIDAGWFLLNLLSTLRLVSYQIGSVTYTGRNLSNNGEMSRSSPS